MSKSLLELTTLSWDAMLNMTKRELKLIPDLDCTYSLKKVREVEFLVFLIDIVKPAVSSDKWIQMDRS